MILVPLASAHVPLDPGDWTITELDARPAAEGGQWFELRNNDPTDGSNLVENGFRDADGDTISLLLPLIAREGEYVVVASEDSTIAEADFRFEATFDLPAEAGSVTLVDHLTGDIDSVAWDATWGAAAGTLAVDPRVETDPIANDRLESWCLAVATPGQQNASCPGFDTGGGETVDSGVDSGDSVPTAETGDSAVTESDPGDSADTGDTGGKAAVKDTCGCAGGDGLALLGFTWIVGRRRSRT